MAFVLCEFETTWIAEPRCLRIRALEWNDLSSSKSASGSSYWASPENLNSTSIARSNHSLDSITSLLVCIVFKCKVLIILIYIYNYFIIVSVSGKVA